MFDHDGNPIYYQSCKQTGTHVEDYSPEPITISSQFADGITPGRFMEFEVARGKERLSMPTRVFADKYRQEADGLVRLPALEPRGGERQKTCLRLLLDRMPSCSRYFATVRRAMSMPLFLSSSTIFWSECGRLAILGGRPAP